jgi:very-short-patch-repair endonuclease
MVVPLPRAIAALAKRQKGYVANRQLRALGMTQKQIQGAIARGQLFPRYRGVYAVGHTALPPFADEMAAVLAIGADAFIARGSCAALYGFGRRWVGDVQITVVGRRVASRAGIKVHCVSELHPYDTTRRDGTPVITPARTLIDQAADERIADHELERQLEEAIIRELVTATKLRAALARAPGRPGTPRLAELIDTQPTAAITRSKRERRMLSLIRRAGLQPPQVNTKVGPFEVDFLWRDARLAVELDGHKFHRSRAKQERDARKDWYLQSVGLRPLRIPVRRFDRTPEAVLVQIVRALAA